MEVSQENTHMVCCSLWWSALFSSFWQKLKAKAIGIWKKIKKTGEDDPRRIIHSFKVGLALTLVSTFYYVTPLYNGFGVSAMWAVLTVVVVMEYTVGGTLSKGLNRAFATLVAGAMGCGANGIADFFGDKGKPVVLSLFVFLLAAMATYSRFIPEIKAKYDYGMTVFILTFSLVAVSSYRVDELLHFSSQRVSTIAIGVGICLFLSICVFPVWAGKDLQYLVAANLEKLASFLEGLGIEHFGEKGGDFEDLEGLSFLQDYKSVLNSKPIEDSLATFARWEPGHGRFGFCHPWRHYPKIGALSRQCAYAMDVLRTYIISLTEDKACKEEVEHSRNILSACTDICTHSAKALKELASTIRTMTAPTCAKPHTASLAAATDKLKTALALEAESLPSVLNIAIGAALLIEIVQCVQQIADSVEELARLAGFKIRSDAIHRATIQPVADEEGSLVVIAIAD